LGRDQWPKESPISPVSPFFNSSDYFELEDMVSPKSSNWNFFFWSAFVVLVIIGLLTWSNSNSSVNRPTPSPTVSSSSVVSSSPSVASY
jgi:hypothetical protein